MWRPETSMYLKFCYVIHSDNSRVASVLHTHTCIILHTQQQVRHFSKMKALILGHKLERNPDVKGKKLNCC